MSKTLLFYGVLLSGIYLWESGVPQASHLLLLFGFIVYLLYGGSVEKNRKNAYLLLFVAYSTSVNLFYFAISHDSRFITSSAQITFNALVFFFTLSMLIKNNSTQLSLIKAIWIGTLIQVLAFLAGLGNYIYFPRYSGTFNDPNQMAYWCLCCLAMYFLLGWKNKYSRFSGLLFSTFIIFMLALTMSRSALLGVTILLLATIGRYISSFNRSLFNLGLIFPIVLLFIMISSVSYISNIHQTEIEFLNRILSTDIAEQADERGYSRFIDFPEYLLLGSGQGGHERFNMNKPEEFISIEMHTTWGGLLHYYGLVGFIFIAAFLINTFRDADKYTILIVLSTFIYGFSTYSFRTPIFWILLAVAAYTSGQSKAGIK